MRYETIADIYSANELIRQRLLNTLDGIDADISGRSEADGWSIADIAEHLAMVEQGTLRICTKLVGAAKESGKAGNGRIDVSSEFWVKARSADGVKIEAPQRVHPTGEQSLETSMERLKQQRAMFDALREDLEHYDLCDHLFPHPFFGDLTAAEWMLMLGGHEARHTDQIERILAGQRVLSQDTAIAQES